MATKPTKHEEVFERYDELLAAVDEYGNADERTERINESVGKVLAGLTELDREMHAWIIACKFAQEAEVLRLEYDFRAEVIKVEPWPRQPIFREFKQLLTKLIRLESTRKN